MLVIFHCDWKRYSWVSDGWQDRTHTRAAGTASRPLLALTVAGGDTVSAALQGLVWEMPKVEEAPSVAPPGRWGMCCWGPWAAQLPHGQQLLQGSMWMWLQTPYPLSLLALTACRHG